MSYFLDLVDDILWSWYLPLRPSEETMTNTLVCAVGVFLVAQFVVLEAASHHREDSRVLNRSGSQHRPEESAIVERVDLAYSKPFLTKSGTPFHEPARLSESRGVSYLQQMANAYPSGPSPPVT